VAAAAACLTAGNASGVTDSTTRTGWPRGTAVVTYANEHALTAALEREPARILRRIPSLCAIEVSPAGDVGRFATAMAGLPGITRVERRAARSPYVEPALAPAVAAGPLQWQYAAVRADAVPDEVRRAAQGQTIAVIDTGADLQAPDIAAKAPRAHTVRAGATGVADRNGHGTFVASLAAGSSSNGDGIAGVAGEARLLVVQAGGADGSFSDVEEAAAIVWAVDHGARILNLSLGGPDASTIERRAVDYAVRKGALLVAAAGNEYASGNPVEYPAALLQPVGSNGVGGRGLVVGASTRAGERAAFSSTGSHLSLAAPGLGVFGALSSLSPVSRYPRVPLPGALSGLYGYASGTSFAAPQVAGAAALVWAANPALTASEVASTLEQSASGRGTWTPELGFGVLDAAVAVEQTRSATVPGTVPLTARRDGRRARLTWAGVPEAASYRVSVAERGADEHVLTATTTGISASYPLAAGVYSFIVAALDAAGQQIAVSAPIRVSMPPAPVRLVAGARRG
jgi:serine protease